MMTHREPCPTPRLPLLLACTALAVLAPAPVRAEVGGHVDVDLELGVPTASFSSSGFSPGVGLGGRFGWRFDLGPVWLQPEIGGHYLTFFDDGACSTLRGCPYAARVFGGARIGGAALSSRVIEPALFLHAGYGSVDDGAPPPIPASRATSPGRSRPRG